jgi:hypothetical protein
MSHTPAEFDAMPAGTVVRTHHGSQWTKKPSGMWRVDSDPEWGPHTSRDIPAYAEVLSVPTTEQQGESQ